MHKSISWFFVFKISVCVCVHVLGGDKWIKIFVYNLKNSHFLFFRILHSFFMDHYWRSRAEIGAYVDFRRKFPQRGENQKPFTN